MTQPLTLPQPLFFKSTQGGKTVFINTAHVVKMELDAVELKRGTLHLDNGTQVEVGANDTDWIMRLMSAHFHEQMMIVGEMKKLSGG